MMKKHEQGVRIKTRSVIWFLFALFVSLASLTGITNPAIATPDKSKTEIPEQNRHVAVLYSENIDLHRSIISSLKDDSTEIPDDIVISYVSPVDKIITFNKSPDLIISIGYENNRHAEEYYPDASTLLLLNDPGMKRSDKTSHSISSTDKNQKYHNALLYFSQPLCRQLSLIHTIDSDWTKVSILSSETRTLDMKTLGQCARRQGISLTVVKTSDDVYLSSSIKKALSQSDVLLALPDKNIYNRRTAKNILLTSYRLRKPVIAFSNSFVKAGALSALYSSPQKIADSVQNLIIDYFNNGNQFSSPVNYPDKFDASINRQVFKALGIPVPDIDKLIKEITDQSTKGSGLKK